MTDDSEQRPYDKERNPRECARCKERGKTWPGSDPKCAFVSGVFDKDNWNCALANDLWSHCEPEYGEKLSSKNVTHHWNDGGDRHFATINISGVTTDGKYGWIGDCLYVAWYKHHGATESMWVVDNYHEPHKPTLAEVEAVVKWLEAGEPVWEDPEEE